MALTPKQTPKVRRWPGVLAAYREWLPVNEDTPPLSLGEGHTPLIRSDRLSDATGAEVYLKLEGANPTGSFKDRGMVLAVAKAAEAGSRAVVCASTGNTSASAAAYAARAGLRCVIVLPHGYVAAGKLAQARIHGAEMVALEGNFDDALRLVRRLAQELPVTLVNSVNPLRLQGQQTAAFEVCDALGRAPDKLCIPVGNAGNISAYWMGFSAYAEAGIVPNRPQMYGFEAAGAAALVAGHPIDHPETFATAIRIGHPASGHLALAAAQASGGGIRAVTDEEIAAAYRLLAGEGVFAEPGSAASVAGLLQLHRQGRVASGETVVCVLTGNGLKDPDSAMRLASGEMTVLPAVERDLQRWLEGVL
ncbi:MAG: threonine synthase [Alicyclobacillus sp.]|nr:threonine synthase [Alicyclobacillus sp.]